MSSKQAFNEAKQQSLVEKVLETADLLGFTGPETAFFKFVASGIDKITGNNKPKPKV